MARIVVDARNLRTSTGRYSRQLLKYLQELDQVNEYHVLMLPEDAATDFRLTAPNFTTHVVPYQSFTFAEQIGLARFLNKLKPDLTHFLMPQQPLFYWRLTITTVHDLTMLRFENLDRNWLVYKIYQNIFRFLNVWVARKSKRLLAPTEFTKSDLAKYAHVTPEKITVTYEAADPLTNTTPKPVEAVKDKPFIMFVGNAFPYKNLSRLSDAVAQLQTTRPDLHLVLVGKKEYFYEQVERHIQAHSYPNMHVAGWLSDDEVAWLYQHAQAYVFPSLSEGFGLPGLEAMQYDLPVVSSNATCLPEVYGQAAHYFNPRDIDDMVRAINEVLTNKKLRQQLVAAGQKQVKKYSWKRMAEQTLAEYRKVLGD